MAATGRWSPGEEERQLLVSWVERCQLAGLSPAACISQEAQHVLVALRQAIRLGAVTNDLGRTARGWGSGFSAPADVLPYLSILRTVLSEPGLGAPGSDNDWLPVPQELLNRLFDQLTREAVDASAASLRAAARTDALTGCANRLALNEDLARSVAASRDADLDLAVAMVDLDGLKRINDSAGHEAGDLALVSLAATLRSVLRSADTLYRIGGDEFVVLAPFTDAAGAEAMLLRASSMQVPPFSWGVSSLGLLGAAAFEQPQLLLSTADARLYSARRQRRAAGAVPASTERRAAAIGWDGFVRRITTATGLATAATVLITVVGALGIALSLEGQSTPKGYSSINVPPATAPNLPSTSRGATSHSSSGGHPAARSSSGGSHSSARAGAGGGSPSVAGTAGGGVSHSSGTGTRTLSHTSASGSRRSGGSSGSGGVGNVGLGGGGSGSGTGGSAGGAGGGGGSHSGTGSGRTGGSGGGRGGGGSTHQSSGGGNSSGGAATLLLTPAVPNVIAGPATGSSPGSNGRGTGHPSSGHPGGKPTKRVGPGRAHKAHKGHQGRQRGATKGKRAHGHGRAGAPGQVRKHLAEAARTALTWVRHLVSVRHHAHVRATHAGRRAAHHQRATWHDHWNRRRHAHLNRRRHRG